MYLEILSEKQKSILPIIQKYNEFYLAGGTALALQIGHRKSIDFDLFKNEEIKSETLIKSLDGKLINTILVNSVDELTLLYDGIKLTFLNYPFNIDAAFSNELQFKITDPLSIGAMKVYALGRRAKWKDYVDLYFLIKEYSLEKLVGKSAEVFGSLIF